MWRSVGFLMSFAVVLEGMSLVAYMVILGGGKRLRENGWKALSLLILLSALVQAGSMAIVVSPFPPGRLSRKEGYDGAEIGRRTSTITKTGSSTAGDLMSPGFSVR